MTVDAGATALDPSKRRSAHSRVGADLQADAVFSNIRLRGVGFRFNYPTLERGLRQVLGVLDE